MAADVRNYWESLTTEIGETWNRFWFSPTDPIALSTLRIIVGAVATLYLVSFVPQLDHWLGPQSILPVSSVRVVLGEGVEEPIFRTSYLNLASSSTDVTILHLIAMIAAICLTLGVATRISSVVTLIAVLSTIHRVPMISSQLEPVLSLLLFYLCLAPCEAMAVDGWLLKRLGYTKYLETASSKRTAWAGVVTRMIQVHLAMFYAMMVTTKLNGEGWWDGNSVWFLLAQTHSRPLDLTFLRDYIYVLNAWTHAVVAFELSYSVLIWNRLLRPIILVWSILMWTLLALATGLFLFAITMIIAGLVFVEPATVRRWLRQPELA